MAGAQGWDDAVTGRGDRGRVTPPGCGGVRAEARVGGKAPVPIEGTSGWVRLLGVRGVPKRNPEDPRAFMTSPGEWGK